MPRIEKAKQTGKPSAACCCKYMRLARIMMPTPLNSADSDSSSWELSTMV